MAKLSLSEALDKIKATNPLEVLVDPSEHRVKEVLADPSEKRVEELLVSYPLATHFSQWHLSSGVIEYKAHFEEIGKILYEASKNENKPQRLANVYTRAQFEGLLEKNC